MIPIPVAYFDSAETRETVYDDAEIMLELVRLCGFDMYAVRLSLVFMRTNWSAYVLRDILDKRRRSV